MHFLDIPKEVIDDSVLKYLKWNDLLRFRRVCKWTKGITNAYLWVIPARAPEIEVNEADKTLEAFMAMGIPTRRLFLNNAKSGYYFYKQIEEETLTKFLEAYGPLVKKLRVAQLTITPFGRELEFIDGLRNVKSFEASYFGDGGMKGGEGEWGEAENAILAGNSQDDPRLTNFGLPKIFEGLESIRIGLDPYGFCKTFNVADRCCQTFLNSPRLKYASLPYDSGFFQTNQVERRGEGGGQLLYNRVMGKSFSHLFIYITQRPNEAFTSEDGKEQLEVYDFENYHHENKPCTLEDSMELLAKLLMIWFASQWFLKVSSRALEMGLKLRNVNASWFSARFCEINEDDYSSPQLGFPVVSLVGLDPCMMDLDLPNLEKITIPFTSRSVSGDLPRRPSWNALKCMDITVDGKIGKVWDFNRKATMEEIEQVIGQPTWALYQFLFGNGIVCENMSELSIQFVEGKGRKDVAVPKVEDIVASCPNLKRIKLENWMGSNKQLVQLWKGLSGLEEIYLENCRELGNVAFVGDDTRYPVFMGLENLKKLSLKGLDKMSKITDTLFSMVLSKMKLKELVLTSEKPLEKVTKKGISALLEGPFAETIARFPFQGWSLADMTAEEFQEMAKKFRSYDMI